MSANSPNRPSSSSKASAATDFRKATQPRFALIAYASRLAEMLASRCVLRGACSTPSRWASTHRRRSCATRIEHGVEVRPVCVNASRWDCTLEPTERGQPLRRPPRPAHGQGARPTPHGAAHRRRRGPISPSPRSTICGAAPACPSAALVQLAEADAFRPALGLARREALWAIKALRDEPLPLFAAASAREAADRARGERARRRRCGR